MSPEGQASQTIEIEGRAVKLSNLDKVLYPEAGFTKGEILDYYARIAPVMLPHLTDRPVTFIRYPDGVDASGFFAKHAPAHRPSWVRTADIAASSSGKKVQYVLIDGLASLMWAANLAAIEFHVPQWRVSDQAHHDLLVLDLDPGAPATVVDCVRVALAARDLLSAHGLELSAKTSGAKGLHLYAPLTDVPGEQARELAHTIARALEGTHRDLVVSSMAKAERPGKVFVDWSQNTHAKTTIAPYSLRATPQPAVSAPVTWEQLAAAKQPEDLRFPPARALEQVARYGDLLSGL
ncbi:non-homologous end-joining DNA ligase [Catenulispora sp. NF23]|uniref:Non-homologous end-joining DNA ligase n=1 Tax=Catenulispora pinistramenti TaxID=2705254 RepID=A0ABS5KTP4_9ACTN|nr:non-homologous end-joining DNA ligase [Catenulispora pinistramenti]MBS2537943.1 non-homologous end-joining DNA ligase [Catenulispora pinistramenti]MBS2549375.1 non-homologous end-joining DNA ligase [Catenulispora pinistramenti]